MATERIGAVLLIAGSVVFLVGAAVGVPRVFTERDPAVRLRLLEAGLASWQAAQPLYGLGAVTAAVAVGFLAAAAPGRAGRSTLAVACLALVVGALAWSWSVYQRGTRVSEFASGTLPGWPFTTYVLVTIGGLALLGAGLFAGRFPAWLAWLTVAADAVFLIGYLWAKDIPPFVFYLLLLLVGAIVL